MVMINTNIYFYRYRKYMGMSAKGVIQPEKLPPTDRAAYFHGLRAHYQIVSWKQLQNCHELSLDPKEWGWSCNKNKRLRPIPTDREVAPECILKIHRCNCKPSKNQCATNRCSCRKNGLRCVSTCGECNGQNCGDKEVTPKLIHSHVHY